MITVWRKQVKNARECGYCGMMTNTLYSYNLSVEPDLCSVCYKESKDHAEKHRVVKWKTS